MAQKKAKLIFTIEKARPRVITERGIFCDSETPAMDVFFKVNGKIPTITFGDKKPQVAYSSHYSSDTTSCGQIKFYHPKTYLLLDGRYKLVLEKNQDFHKAIRGLACFIQFGGLGNLGCSGNGGFGEGMYPSTKNPNFEIKYASKDLEKTLEEI